MESDDEKKPCPECGGHGLGPDRIDGPGDVYQDPCDACEGTGVAGGTAPPKVAPKACEDCGLGFMDCECLPW